MAVDQSQCDTADLSIGKRMAGRDMTINNLSINSENSRLGMWRLPGFTRVCSGGFRTTCIYFDSSLDAPIESDYHVEWVGSEPTPPEKAGTLDDEMPINLSILYDLKRIEEAEQVAVTGMPNNVQGTGGMGSTFMQAISISPGSASPFIEKVMDDIWRMRAGLKEADEIRGIPITRFRIKRLWELDMRDGVTDNQSREINDHLYQRPY